MRRDPPAFRRAAGRHGWLPARYQEGDPESGMGGGIGQWLLFRAGDRSLTLFALVVPSGSQTPIHDHLAWGLVGLYRGTQDEEIYARDDAARSSAPRREHLRPATSTRCCRRATTSTACARPRPRRRSRCTCSPTTPAACGATRSTRGPARRRRSARATSTWTARRVIHSARPRARTRPSVLRSADAVWCLRPWLATCQPSAIAGSPTSTQSSRSTASRASRLGCSQSHSGGV